MLSKRFFTIYRENNIGPADSKFFYLLSDKNILILLILPVLILLINNRWIYNPIILDTWIYFGYYQNYPQHLQIFPGTYYGTRLAYILPGYLFYKLFPPLTANYILHLGYYYISIISLYLILKYTMGKRTALFTSILMAFYVHFMCSAGMDYSDGPSIMYCLLALLFLTRAIKFAEWEVSLCLSGMFFALIVHSNLFGIIYTPVFAFYYIFALKKRDKIIILQSLKFFMIGALGITFFLCIINYIAGGEFLFFLPSITFAISFAPQANPWKAPSYNWLLSAFWLILPATIFISTLVSVIWDRLKKISYNDNPFILLFYLNYILITLIMIMFQLKGKPTLQLIYYASYLIPFMFIAIGSLFTNVCKNLKKNQFIILIAVEISILFFSIFQPFMLFFKNLVKSGNYYNYLVIITFFSGLLVLFIIKYMNYRLSFLFVLFFGFASFMHNIPPGSTHTLSKNDFRKDILLAVLESMETVREFAPNGNIRFWYNEYAALGKIAYRPIASTYLWAYRLINPMFPSLEDYNLPGSGFQAPNISHNTRIVILSDEKNAFEQATESLKNIGYKTELLSTKEIKQGKIQFTMTFIKVLNDEFFISEFDKNDFVLTKSLINLSGDDLVNNLQKNIYGKFGRLGNILEESGHVKIGQLASKIEKVFYGKTGHKDVLTKANNTFLFRPTTRRDHLATPFTGIDQTNEKGEKWLRLKLSCSDSEKPGSNCKLLVQDENFNTLFSMMCYDPSEKPSSDGYIKNYIKLSENVKSVRLTIISNDGKETFLPNALILDQLYVEK